MRIIRWLMITSLALAANVPAAPKKPPVPVTLAWPSSGGAYRVEYLESISKPADLSIRRSFFAKLGDILVGPSRQPQTLFRPFTIAADAQGRLLITDPGAGVVHLLDPARNKHRVLQGPSRERFLSPIGLDFDAAGNIYVSDSILGKIFVFDKDGRFRRFLGDVPGEGFFKRPTGLAVDRATHRLYLTDTLRHKVYVLDPEGKVERARGRRGSGPGEFNFPTAIALAENRVFVLDAMNFRVQVFTSTGEYISSFGRPANEPGGFFRPKGLATDARNKLVFVVDAMFEVIQAFTFEGDLVMATAPLGRTFSSGAMKWSRLRPAPAAPRRASRISPGSAAPPASASNATTSITASCRTRASRSTTGTCAASTLPAPPATIPTASTVETPPITSRS